MGRGRNINWEEWLTELNKPSTRDGFTTREAMKVWGVNLVTAREKLRELIDQGRVVLIDKKTLTAIDGKSYVAPLFQVVKKR